MDIDEVLDLIDEDSLEIYDTPLGVKLSAKSETGAAYEFTSDELEALKQFTDIYEEPVTAIYNAVEESDGDRQHEEVGRVIVQSEVSELPRVVSTVKGIPLDTEDCSECREMFKNHDKESTR